MEYHAIHGHDVASFDLPSTHRLPTISAAQAFEDLDSDASKYLPTGIDSLDKLLSGPSSLAGAEKPASAGGIRKGQVTEIWGPSGSGKTSLGVQLAAGALDEGGRVVWVDCLYPVCSQRFSAIVAGGGAQGEANSGTLDRVAQYTCPSLPHFIALLCRPTETSVPLGTSLIVVDSLSALVNHGFPRVPDQKPGHSASKAPNSSARRLQVLQHVISALQKLAATRDLAIVVLTQCASKMQAERGATLVPAINASVWDQGIPTRLVLYRDWAMDDGQPLSAHFAGIQKVDGKTSNAGIGDIAAFRIEPTGLVAASIDSGEAAMLQAHGAAAMKRKLLDTDFEVGASDDEDYGWADDENADLPPNPSQWQGSEDLIVGVHRQDGEDSDVEREEQQQQQQQQHHGPDDEIPASDDDDEPFTQQGV